MTEWSKLTPAARQGPASPRKRGRPKGSKKKVSTKHVGPVSRPAILRSLTVGQSALFEPRAGQSVANLMKQVSSDASRNGVAITQELVLGVNPQERTVCGIVRVTRTK
jgi:hypothetical protein